MGAEKMMRKIISIVIGVFLICQARSQVRNEDTSFVIKEIARTGSKSEFLVIKDSNKYYLTFAKTNKSKGSLYVAYNSKAKYILRRKIEILDTLELDKITYNNDSALLIKTGGNFLLEYVL